MSTKLPEVKHVYQNHLLDSTRWDPFKRRDDDIVVATPFKSGTTWMQTIVLHLILQDLQQHAVDDFSPWMERRWVPLGDLMNRLEAQKHRRCIKSHLPLDALPYSSQIKYIVVGRDARDVFMSLWNHYSNFRPDHIERINNTPGRVGDPFPTCPSDIREFWQAWMTRGWFEWETEGYPFWTNLHHVQSWWDYRHLPNILFVHYNDLLSDLEGQIRRIAEYLEIDVSPELLKSIAEMVNFKNMKQNAEQILPGIERIFTGGPQAFINKGTNGRWRDVLTADDLQLYSAAVVRELTADCAHWLENGDGASDQ